MSAVIIIDGNRIEGFRVLTSHMTTRTLHVFYSKADPELQCSISYLNLNADVSLLLIGDPDQIMLLDSILSILSLVKSSS